MHKKLKVSTIVYQQCSSATEASFWKVRTMNKENVRKFLIRMLTQENLWRFGSNFCSLYAFPEDYISKSKENVEVKEIILYIF